MLIHKLHIFTYAHDSIIYQNIYNMFIVIFNYIDMQWLESPSLFGGC